jgi:uncharacterized membrane protein
MTTATSPVTHTGLDFLGKAALVLLTFQAGALAHMLVLQGLDGPPNGYLFIVMLTALFAGAQRRLARTQVARGAVPWFTASRTAVFAVLAITSLLVVFRGLAAPPARDVSVTATFAAMWVALALKGAAAGKFKPGGYLGLRVYWTTHSRMAWDRAHRVLGRVLFWGGLAGLAASFVMPWPASIALFVATVALAVSLALFESWRTWRDDPDRSGGARAAVCQDATRDGSRP